jgi:hypothetical protein
VIGRRSFLGGSAVGLTAAVGVLGADPALAATTATPWASATWTAIVGKTVTATDTAGTKTTLTVASVTKEAAAKVKTTGESFTVQFSTGSSTLRDALYRLDQAALPAGTTAMLLGGGTGHASLVVNTRIPA